MNGLYSSLQDQVMVVTGAAGGIGRAVTDGLTRLGAKVVGLDCMVATSPDLSCRLSVDLTDDSATRAAVETIEDTVGPIYGLVHAAGVHHAGHLSEVEVGTFDSTFAVNARAMFVLTSAAMPKMVERGEGVVVTVASNAGRVPRTQMGIYGASKAAVAYMTKVFGLEHAGDGIRCNVVSPGSTDTEMLRGLWPDEKARVATLEGSLESFKVGIPNGRIAEPADVADAVVFLCSKQAKHITMQELVVDGGAALGA